MKRSGSSLAALLTFLAVVISSSFAEAQQNPGSGDAGAPEYKSGQVCKDKTAPGAKESMVVILKLESLGKKGNLVHIRINNMPVPSCGGFH